MMLRERVKKRITGFLPLPVRRLLWVASDPKYRAELARIRAFHVVQRKAWAAVWRQTGGVVTGGPFAGMKYLKRTGQFNQKLLGTYEKELDSVVEAICATPYRTIVDVGAAEGYYACGLAMRNESARVIAFEQRRTGQADIRALTRLNGVDSRINVDGRCDHAQLRKALLNAGRTLIVCDIDGGESELLTLEAVPELRHSDLLVETHDGRVPGVTAELTGRFAHSHEVTRIRQTPRAAVDFPAQLTLPEPLILGAMDEFRGDGNDWLWMGQRRQS